MLCAFVYIYVHMCVPMQTHMEGRCWLWVSSYDHFSIFSFEAGSLMEPWACFSISARLTGQLTARSSCLCGPHSLEHCLQIYTVHLLTWALVIWNQVLGLVWQTLYPLSRLSSPFNIFSSDFFSALDLITWERTEAHDYLVIVTMARRWLRVRTSFLKPSVS